MRADRGKPLAWLEANATYSDDACLLWPFGKSNGYGVISRRGEAPTMAHRLMCIIAHGPHPEGQSETAHSCGNRACVNPRHLRHASPRENGEDKILHDRVNRGERNGQSKLTRVQAQQIVGLYVAGGVTQKQIAAKFGIRDSTVNRIISGKRWAHLRAGEDVPGAHMVIGSEGLSIRTK
jgi:hypothetical protein